MDEARLFQNRENLGFIVIKIGRGPEAFYLDYREVIYCGSPIYVLIIAHILYLTLELEDDLEFSVAVRADPYVVRTSQLITSFNLYLFV
jgi:hypothetical protein